MEIDHDRYQCLRHGFQALLVISLLFFFLGNIILYTFKLISASLFLLFLVFGLILSMFGFLFYILMNKND